MTSSRRASVDAGIDLAAFLEGRRLADLQAYYMFWVGVDPIPDTVEALIRQLGRRMRNAETVRALMKMFTRSQREILLAVADADGHEVEKGRFLKHGLEGVAQPYEAEAAARSLLQRGFLAEIPAAAGRPARYAIPREVGALVGRLGERAARSSGVLFRLAGTLDGMKTDVLSLRMGRLLPRNMGFDRDQIVAAILDPDAIRARVEAIEDRELRKLVRTVATQFGGLLTRTLFFRIRSGKAPWDLEAMREVLEAAALGTAVRLDLEDYGIALSEETLIVHAEVVDALLSAERPAPSAETRRVNLGADVVSDVDRVLAFLGRETVRITQDQSIYKTVRRRLRDALITREPGRLTRDKALDFLLEFMREKAFFSPRAGKVIRPTRAGMNFTQLDVDTQMRRLVQHVLVTFPVDTGGFHHRPLLNLFLESFRELEPDQWHDPMELPFRARNTYLAELDSRRVKAAFERRFEYAMAPPREDPFQMAWRLFDLLTEWFVLLGLVEAAVEGDRIRAVRITALGRRMLGPQEAAGTDTRKSRRKPAAKPRPSAELIVTPDFEVLLHPGPRTLEAVHYLDRFCERLHADHHMHFRIDRERFQDLVGRGTDAEHILTFLTEHAQTSIPENVAVTLRDWAATVRFVEAQQVLLLEAPDPEVLDRIEKSKEIRATVARRISPNLLALDARKVNPDLVEQLRGIGVFMRG